MVDMDAFSRTITQETFYTAISRARADATLYTNDAAKLSKAVSLPMPKTAALELHVMPQVQGPPGPELSL